MFKKLNSVKLLLALALCLALAAGMVCGAFPRAAYAAEDGVTMSAPDEGADEGDDIMSITSEGEDKPEEGDDASGEPVLTIGAAEEDEEDAGDKWERNIKLFTIIGAALVLAIVLVVYFVFRGSKAKKVTTRMLVESALMIAIASVLSIIKIDSPFGGGVTLVSMLPIIYVSHRWGWSWGVVTAFVYSIIQLFMGLDNVGYASSPVMALGIILLDYIVAYTVIGLSGVFGKSFHAVAAGILVTFTLRFLCHWVCGAMIWGVWMPEEYWGQPMTNPWVYSAMYNGWYMAIELIISEAVAMLLYKPIYTYVSGKKAE